MGSGVLADTNILIDLLAGVAPSLLELRKHEHRAVSVISRIELFVGLREGERTRAESLLSNFVQVELTPAIVEESIRVRQTTRPAYPEHSRFFSRTVCASPLHLVSRYTLTWTAEPGRISTVVPTGTDAQI